MTKTEIIIKVSGIFLGILARTLLPWIRKLRKGEVTAFAKRYVVSAVGTLLMGIVITLLIFPSFKGTAPLTQAEDWVKLFCLAFGFGFGWNAIVLEAGQWAGAFDVEPEQKAGKSKAK